MTQQHNTPFAQGYHMPARFEPHARTLITWPPQEEEIGTSVSGFRDEIEQMARAISRFESVTLLVDPRDVDDVRQRCSSFADIFEIAVDACWIRDNGPIFVRNAGNEVAGVHFGFNGWGERIQCPATQEMPSQIVNHFGMKCFRTPFIGEGGGISVDGEGTMFTTEQNMLNTNRYAGMSRDDVEQKLHDYLGIEKVIWLELGLFEDNATDGHVDNVVEFVAPGVVLAQVVKDRSNPNYDRLQDNLKRINATTDAKGRHLEIIEMDVLPYSLEKAGKGCAIPYTNAYVINGAVIVPEVDPTLDDRGFQILQQAYRGREIVPVPSTWQAVAGGGIACVTQQIPAGIPAA